MPAKQDIKEYSVFESIDAKRYHSCVITGYSYDFIYFDEIVFPILRKKGITNIIILIDASMLENALKKISTSHFKHSQAYSISSIRKTGAFHPKIVQCFSEKEGLLTIGSGNPTHGGYSANWEAWISFHVEHANDSKTQGFLKTWHYVKQLSSDIRGIVNQKLSWIEEYAPWLKEIKTADSITMNPLTDGYTFAVLDNARSGIYSEMTELIPSKKAEVINIHSPFFDDDLSILRLLFQTYSPEKMNIFIQPGLTVLNSKNLKNLNGTLDFYDINQCMASFSKAAQRYAHAKLLEIRFQNQSYFLLGSANLSKSAFGTDSFSPRNAEISVLLHSQSGTNFFDNLGLTPQKEAKYSLEQIDSLVSSNSFISDTSSQDHHIYHIDSIDRSEKHYSVFLPASPQHQLNLKVYDFRGIEIATIKQNEEITHGSYCELTFLKTNVSEDAVSGCLYETKQLSNIVVVQDVFAQTRSYPNPTYRKLKTTLHSIENGEDHLWKLFNLIEPEKLITEPSDLTKRHSDSSQDRHNEEDKDFKVISHEELQKKLQMPESQTKLFERHFQRDNALQVLSILNSVMGRAITNSL